MSKQAVTILTMIPSVLCGCPGTFFLVAGVLLSSFGLLADQWQLKMDTNLDKMSVIMTGAGGIVIGLVLVAIPVVIWWLKR